MKEALLLQFQHESSGYKRLIRFLADETVYMKNRITEVLQNDFHNNMLEGVEYFQNEFLKIDEIIGFLRNSIAELDRYLSKDFFEDKNKKETKMIRESLCKKIIVAKNRFYELQTRFNDFLLTNIGI